MKPNVESVIADLEGIRRVDRLLLANVRSGCRTGFERMALTQGQMDFLIACLLGAQARLETYPHAHTKEGMDIATWINSLDLS